MNSAIIANRTILERNVHSDPFDFVHDKTLAVPHAKPRRVSENFSRPSCPTWVIRHPSSATHYFLHPLLCICFIHTNHRTWSPPIILKSARSTPRKKILVVIQNSGYRYKPSGPLEKVGKLTRNFWSLSPNAAQRSNDSAMAIARYHNKRHFNSQSHSRTDHPWQEIREAGDARIKRRAYPKKKSLFTTPWPRTKALWRSWGMKNSWCEPRNFQPVWRQTSLWIGPTGMRQRSGCAFL